MVTKKMKSLIDEETTMTPAPARMRQKCTNPLRVRCNLMKKVGKNAVWLKKEPVHDLELIRKTLDDFQAHLNCGCFCSSRSATYLAMSATHLEMFILMSKNSLQFLDEQESLARNNAAEAKKEKKSNLNDIETKNKSSFVDTINENVNQSNFIKLINSVFNALKTLQKAFQLDETEKVFTRIFLDRMNILTNLNTLFEIFIYYGLNVSAFHVADLTMKMIDEHYLNAEDDEIIVAKHNVVKFYLKLGFVDVAKTFFKRYFSNMKFEDVTKIETYGHSLVFLLHCELSLRNRDGKAVASKLKQFIGSEYLKKGTIKRYILKAQASLLASRFPSAIYPFETLSNEFLDPIQISVGICRRWNLFNKIFSAFDNCSTNDNFHDPWWQRFATFNIFSESLEDFLEFQMNNGLTNDPAYYYKIAHNLFTITLNLKCLAKLQLLGAKYDIYNGFFTDAESKLLSFKMNFKNSDCSNEALFNGSLFQLESNFTQSGEENLEDGLILRTNQLMIDDNEDSDDEDAPPAERMFKCYKRLMMATGSRSKFDDNDDYNDQLECQLDISSMEKLLELFVKDFGGIKLPTDMIINLFHLYLYYLIDKILLDYHRCDCKTPDVLSRQNYCLLLKLMESFTIGVYWVTYRELSGQSLKIKSTMKTSMNEQLVNGPIGEIFWVLSDCFVRIMIDHGIYRETLCFLNKLIDISSHSYQIRIYRCKMFYYRALVLYKLMKKVDGVFPDPKKIFRMKTNVLTENLKVINPLDEKLRTPPGNRSKSVQKIIPKSKMMAPKKDEGMSTVKKYGKSLLQKVSEAREGLEGTRKNILDFDEPEIIDTETDFGPKSVCREVKNHPKSNKTTNLLQSNSNFGIYEDDDADAETKSNSMLISNFISNSNLTTLNEDFLEKLFNLEEFEKTFDIKSITVDDVKFGLRKILSYIGSQISFPLYLQIHELFFKLAKATSKSSQNLAYHFAEMAPCHAFRHRYMFNVIKKMANAKSLPFDHELISFKAEDFIFQNYINEFPKTWRFVQIKPIENGTKYPDLMLCRFQAGCRPIFIKIKTDLEKVTKHFMEEFEEIMKMNYVSIFETEKEAFWKLRFEYDSRLKVLLRSVENAVLGLAKGLFLGQLNDKKYATMCSWFKKKVLEIAKVMNIECEDLTVLDVITESMALLKPEEAEVAAKILFNTENSKFLAKFVECRKKGFTTWSKEDKLQQLYEDAHPVGLIIDPSMIQFPFESLPSFRLVNQPFFRIPSLRVASFLYRNHRNTIDAGVKEDETFYMLNPGNNLNKTEEFFKRPMQAIRNWTGTVGNPPDGKSLMENFEKKDIYIYMGHGSGSLYYRTIPNGLDVVNMKTAALVVGCSSGRITRDTKLSDMFGSAYRFLINGAPTYIGTLWDITDKDIDIFFNRFMTHWFKQWNPEEQKYLQLQKFESICRSICFSRDTCKLKYLIGCAPVIYGLPIKNGSGGSSESG